MDPEEEGPQGEGQPGSDEADDEGPRPHWLPPDDRLWRHPSEVRQNPPTDLASGHGLSGALASWLRASQAPIWLVGVISGVVGALLTTGVLLVTGATERASPPPPTTSRSLTVTPPRTTPSSPGATWVWGFVNPSIVGVKVTGAQGTTTGSGVIVDSVGQNAYILTQSNLFSSAGAGPQVEAATSYTLLSGALMGTDPSSGIALVQARMSPVRTAELGSAAELQTGEEVYAVGSPSAAAWAGSGNYFASGTINDSLNYLPPVNGASVGLFSMLVANLSVDPSAYGGALVDTSGKVIGILNPASAELDKPSVTYVTPIDTAMEELGPLISSGHPAPHAWLGLLQGSDASPPAVPKGVPGGVAVASVAPGSPAAKAGIVDNDVVTEIDTTSVTSSGVLIALLANMKPGQVVKLSWVHDGKVHQAEVTLGEQPDAVNGS